MTKKECRISPTFLSVIKCYAALSSFFLRTIKNAISAPTAAEPTHESVSVPAPIADAVAGFSDLLELTYHRIFVSSICGSNLTCGNLQNAQPNRDKHLLLVVSANRFIGACKHLGR